MERSVPAGMSPVWRGITVWQWPQRQIWCDRLCRTGSQPSWRLRINARAVTLSVYQVRRISVYSIRRARSVDVSSSDQGVAENPILVLGLVDPPMARPACLAELFGEDLAAQAEAFIADGLWLLLFWSWSRHEGAQIDSCLAAERARKGTAIRDGLQHRVLGWSSGGGYADGRHDARVADVHAGPGDELAYLALLAAAEGAGSLDGGVLASSPSPASNPSVLDDLVDALVAYGEGFGDFTHRCACQVKPSHRPAVFRLGSFDLVLELSNPGCRRGRFSQQLLINRHLSIVARQIECGVQVSLPLGEAMSGTARCGLGRDHVSLGTADSEPEEVCQSSDVAAGGERFVQDAVIRPPVTDIEQRRCRLDSGRSGTRRTRRSSARSPAVSHAPTAALCAATRGSGPRQQPRPSRAREEKGEKGREELNMGNGGRSQSSELRLQEGQKMLDQVWVLWWYLRTVVEQANFLDRIDRNEEGSVVEKVILTAIFAALAIAIGAIIVSKITAKANSINLN